MKIFVTISRRKHLEKLCRVLREKWRFSNIRLALPNFIINGIIDGMGQFAEKIHEFDHPDTLLLGLNHAPHHRFVLKEMRILKVFLW